MHRHRPTLAGIAREAGVLTAFAWRLRYPGIPYIPDAEETETFILKFVPQLPPKTNYKSFNCVASVIFLISTFWQTDSTLAMFWYGPVPSPRMMTP